MSGDADTLAADLARIPGGSPEDLAEVFMRYEAQARRARDELAAIKDALVEHIQATGQPLVVGEIEYRAGHRKETKCLSNDQAADAVFSAVGGDVKTFAACLASSAFLPGACRKVLPPDEFARLFETVDKPVLIEGKPKPQLVGFNPKFTERNRHDRHTDAATAAIE
jgi:hypothetical protein